MKCVNCGYEGLIDRFCPGCDMNIYSDEYEAIANEPETAFESFGRDDDLVTCKVYEDGDVVVNHGAEGGCVNLADTSGYDPLLDLCAGLGLSADFEDDVLDFVQDNTGVFA